MSNELKPCPFCGGEAYIYETNPNDNEDILFNHYGASCQSCHTTVGSTINGLTNFFGTPQEAIEAWNTRAERTCHLERIPYEPGEYEGMRCSVCKTVYLEMGVGPYCPGCGAKVVD